MTLNDLLGYVHIGGLLKCDFWYNCAAVDKLLTDTACYMVLLQ